MLLGVAVPVIVLVLFGYHRMGGWPVSALWKVFWPTAEGLMYAALIVF